MAKTAPQPANVSQTNQTVRLPVILETVFTLSKLTVILSGIIVLVITFAMGNPYWVALLRAGITVLSLGLIVWFISWIMAKGVVNSARTMIKEAQENESSLTGSSFNTKA